MRSTALAVSAVLVVALVPMLALAQQPASPQPNDAAIKARLELARQVSQDFLDEMRTRIKAALRDSGPVGAIGACRSLAPDVANASSVMSGFEVERTALRLRNPENAPDSWELKVLELFQSKTAGGADAGGLEHFEVVRSAEGDRLFRYMRGIAMAEACLGCHGPDVRQDVRAEIARYYPADKATGFRVGDLRGAVSLTQIIED